MTGATATSGAPALAYLRQATGFLAARGVPNARLDAELLLADVLGVDRVGVYLGFDRPLDDAEVAAYREAIRRRGRREPLQHIRRRQEFHSRDFRVGPEALVPRPETELLVEEAILRARGIEGPRILEIGCGSGVIAVTVALEVPGARVAATDLLPGAVDLTRENARALGVEDRLELAAADLAGPFAEGSWDLVLSNPPYVASGDLDRLEPEVRDFDPRVALDGGPDGLTVIRRLFDVAASLLAPAGVLVVEIGAGQREPVARAAAAAGLRVTAVKPDLAGIDRVVILEPETRSRTGTEETS